MDLYKYIELPLGKSKTSKPRQHLLDEISNKKCTHGKSAIRVKKRLESILCVDGGTI